ncbi:MAG: CBS domain-containing protein [Dehalococcoidia bacterium]|nr:CBS domain-containing protein [Dehalococcoidia bacterium]
MYVRDIMTTNVVTIPSSTSIADAKRIMEAHRFRRLPVVDKGKLVGIVTEHKLEEVSPSKATSLSVWELSYLLDKTTVKEIMERNVVTVSPDMTVEESLAVAQGNKVGALVVVEAGRVVGIATTNDFFYKIVNPILGLGEPGTRVEITGGGECKSMEEIISTINKLGLNVVTCHIIAPPETAKKDVVVHVDTEDASRLVSELEGKGYKASVRRR